MASNDKTVFDPDATKPENDRTVYEGDKTVLDSAETVREGSTTLLDAALSDGLARAGEAPVDNIAIRKGETILDTYTVESDAIEGGMGSVWRVHHKGWNVDLAMKRPQPQCFSTEKSKADFIHECEAWINLGLHPNIVSCYYVREISGTPTIFSEWMDGGSLERAIGKGTLYAGSEAEQQERVLDIAIQFARGLHYAHEAGLIHQDVKPDNLLLTKEGEAKVADFGLAKARAVLTVLDGAPTMHDSPDAGKTIISPSGGYTPAYCSMEQMDGKELTRRTDIYSWAVSVMEMYCGSRPWANGVVAGLGCSGYLENTRVPMPDALKELLAQCMDAEPENRPHDFGLVEAKLHEIYNAEMGEPYPRPAPKAAADTADSLNNRALSYLDLGKGTEAEKLWERAIEMSPNHADATFNHILSMWRAGKIDDQKAMGLLDSALLHDAPNKRLFMALLHMERGRYPDAETALRGCEAPEAEALREELKAKISTFRFSDDALVLASGCKLTSRTALLALRSQALLYCPVGSCDLTMEPAYAGADAKRFTLSSHTAPVTRIAASADGCLAASASEDGTVRVWALENGELLRTLPVRAGWMTFDGHNGLWTQNIDSGSLTRFSLTDGAESAHIALDGRVSAMALCKDTFILAELDSQGATHLTVRHRRDGTVFGSFPCDIGVTEMRINEDESSVTVTDGKTKYAGFALPGGAQLFLREFSGATFAALTADGRYAQINYQSSTNGFQLVALSSGRVLRSYSMSMIVTEAQWADDTHLLLHCAQSTSAGYLSYYAPMRALAAPAPVPYRLCKIQSTNQRMSMEARMRAHKNAAEAALGAGRMKEALDELNNARAVPGYEQNAELRALNARIGEKCQRVGLFRIELENETEFGGPVPAATELYGTRIMTVDGQSLEIRDAASGAVVAAVKRRESKRRIQQCLLSPGAKYAAIGCYGGMELYGVQSGKLIWSEEVNFNGRYSLSFGAGGEIAVIGSPAGDVIFFDLDKKRVTEKRHIFDAPQVRPNDSLIITGVGYSGDPLRLRVVYTLPSYQQYSYDSHGAVFQGEPRALIKQIDHLNDELRLSGSFSTADGEAYVLLYEKGATLYSRSGKIGLLYGRQHQLAFSADDRFLLCAGDQYLHIASLDTGERLHTIELKSLFQPNEMISAFHVAFTQDGSHIVLIARGKRFVWALDWEYSAEPIDVPASKPASKPTQPGPGQGAASPNGRPYSMRQPGVPPFEPRPASIPHTRTTVPARPATPARPAVPPKPTPPSAPPQKEEPPKRKGLFGLFGKKK